METKKSYVSWISLGFVSVLFAFAAAVFFGKVGMEGSFVPPVAWITVLFGAACLPFLLDKRKPDDPFLLLLGAAVIGGLIATAIASAQRQRLRQDVSVAATYQKA